MSRFAKLLTTLLLALSSAGSALAAPAQIIYEDAGKPWEVQCPPELTGIVCDRGKYDPRHYVSARSASGDEVFRYDEAFSGTFPLDITQDPVKSVYALGLPDFKSEMIQAMGENLIASSIQYVALTSENPGPKMRETMKTALGASCLWPDPDASKREKKIEAFYQGTIHATLDKPPGAAEIRRRYKDSVFSAGQCMAVIQDRLATIGKDFGEDIVKAHEELQKQVRKEWSTYFVSAIPGVTYFEHLPWMDTALTQTRCGYVVDGYCRGVSDERESLRKEYRQIVATYPMLIQDGAGQKPFYEDIREAGIDPRVKDHPENCMDQFKTPPQIEPRARLELEATLRKRVYQYLQSFDKNLGLICQNQDEYLEREIKDRHFLKGYFSCDSQVAPFYQSFTDLPPRKWSSRRLEGGACRDRLNERWLACQYYKDNNSNLPSPGEVATNAAVMGINGVTMIGPIIAPGLGLAGSFEQALGGAVIGGVFGAGGAVAEQVVTTHALDAARRNEDLYAAGLGSQQDFEDAVEKLRNASQEEPFLNHLFKATLSGAILNALIPGRRSDAAGWAEAARQAENRVRISRLIERLGSDDYLASLGADARVEARAARDQLIRLLNSATDLKGRFERAGDLLARLAPEVRGRLEQSLQDLQSQLTPEIALGIEKAHNVGANGSGPYTIAELRAKRRILLDTFKRAGFADEKADEMAEALIRGGVCGDASRMRIPKRDFYDVLGVARTASEKEIKSAYRKLAHKFHPDKNPGDAAAEESFKEVGAAYEILGNPDRRSQYDQLGTAQPASRSAARSAAARAAAEAWADGAAFKTRPAPSKPESFRVQVATLLRDYAKRSLHKAELSKLEPAAQKVSNAYQYQAFKYYLENRNSGPIGEALFLSELEKVKNPLQAQAFQELVKKFNYRDYFKPENWDQLGVSAQAKAVQKSVQSYLKLVDLMEDEAQLPLYKSALSAPHNYAQSQTIELLLDHGQIGLLPDLMDRLGAMAGDQDFTAFQARFVEATETRKITDRTELIEFLRH